MQQPSNADNTAEGRASMVGKASPRVSHHGQAAASTTTTLPDWYRGNGCAVASRVVDAAGQVIVAQTMSDQRVQCS